MFFWSIKCCLGEHKELISKSYWPQTCISVRCSYLDIRTVVQQVKVRCKCINILLPGEIVALIMFHVHRTSVNTTPSPPQGILGEQLLRGLVKEWLERVKKHQWRAAEFLKLFFLLCSFFLETPRQKANDVIGEVHRARVGLWEDIDVGTPLWCISTMSLSNEETTKSQKRRYGRMPSTVRKRQGNQMITDHFNQTPWSIPNILEHNSLKSHK